VSERVREQVLLEIALSLGGESDPERLLEASLPLIARRTGSPTVGVLRLDEVGAETVAITPKVLGARASWRDLAARVVSSARRDDPEGPQQRAAWQVDTDAGVAHVFRLPDFGVLVIVRPTPLEESFVKGFTPLADVLARPLVAAVEQRRRLSAERSAAVLGLRQRGLLDALPFPAWLVDDEGRYVEANDAFHAMVGHDVGDIAGLSPTDLVPAARTDGCLDKLEAVLATGEPHHEEQRDHTSGRVLELNLTPYVGEAGEVIGVVGFQRDITDRHATLAELEDLSRLRELLTSLAVDFVNTPLQEVDAAIDDALARTGAFVEADRSYVFRYDFEAHTASNTHEWCATGIEPMIEHLQQEPMSSFPLWLDTHLRGEVMHFPDVLALPEQHEARQILEPQGVLTIITLPMFADGDCLGFVGFDAVSGYRTWSPEAREVLKVLAELIANAEQRRRREADLVAARAEAEDARGGLELALRSGSGALWHYDAASDEALWSGGLVALAGQEPVPRRGGVEVLFDLMAPEEALRFDERFREVIAGGAHRFELEATLRHVDGHDVPVRCKGAIDRDDDGRALRAAGTVADLTLAKQEQERAARRLRFEALLVEISARFLGPESFDDALEHALADLGEVYGASRVDILEIDGATLSNTHEWCAPGVAPMRQDTQGIALEAIASSVAKLARGETLAVGDVDALPDERSLEREVLQRQGVRSLISLPLLIGGELHGAIGLEHTERTHAWSQEDLGLLRSAAELIAGAIARARTEAELVAAREAAEAASEAKTWLLSTISHELRTPMNGVLGMADLVLDEELTGRQRRRLETVRSSAQGLLAQLDDLLDVARMEGGTLELRPQPTDVRAVLDDVVALARVDAERRGLALSATVAPGVPGLLEVDEARLRQIVANLTGNAVKFTEAGFVAVEAAPGAAGEGLRLRVSDSGVGIPEAAREEVFQPFVRVEDLASRRAGGTGLGLSIVRELVELMGGRIVLADRRGGGTVVTVDLPLPAAEGAGGEAPPRPVATHGLRVLVADDDPVNREVLSGHLAEFGCRVRTVNDGAEAVEVVAREPVDVVLMDCYMPNLDGFAAARAIRELPEVRPDLPVLAITADASGHNLAACHDAGMDDVIVKPVGRSGLLSAIGASLRHEGAATPTAPGGGPDAAEAGATGSGVDDGEPVLDLTPLEGLRHRQSGHGSLAARLTDLFLEQAPRYVEQLDTAARDGDAESFHVAAHTLKSNAATLGLRRLRELAALAEAEAKRAGADADQTTLAKRLAAEADEALEALGRLRDDGWLEAAS